MTRKDFYNLEPFDEEKFRKGEKVLVLEFGRVVEPTEQRYFDEHPDPIVLKYNDKYHSFGLLFAEVALRMAPNQRYKAIPVFNLWAVIDTAVKDDPRTTVANFYIEKESGKMAKEYADFLNNKESDKTNLKSVEDGALLSMLSEGLQQTPQQGRPYIAVGSVTTDIDKTLL